MWVIIDYAKQWEFFSNWSIFDKYIVYLFFIYIIYLDNRLVNFFSVHFEIKKIRKEIYLIFVCLYFLLFRLSKTVIKNYKLFCK